MTPQQVVKKTLHRLGFYAFGARRAPGVTVLCYHGLSERPASQNSHIPNAFLHICRDDFERQMDHLRRHFNPISYAQLTRWLDRKESLPDRPVLVTFDDSYESVYRLAAPILSKYQIPAILFVTTDALGSAGMLWPDRVHLDFLQDPHGFKPPSEYEQSFFSENKDAVYDLIEWLKTCPDGTRQVYLDAINKKNSSSSVIPDECRVLDLDQLKALAKLGFGIGSHTCSHPILANTHPERQLHEIRDSKKLLEVAVGGEASTFTYPNGRLQDFTDETVALLKTCGYKTAFTTVEGYVLERSDPYRLSRFLVFADLSIEEFSHRLAFSWPGKYRVSNV